MKMCKKIVCFILVVTVILIPQMSFAKVNKEEIVKEYNGFTTNSKLLYYDKNGDRQSMSDLKYSELYKTIKYLSKKYVEMDQSQVTELKDIIVALYNANKIKDSENNADYECTLRNLKKTYYELGNKKSEVIKIWIGDFPSDIGYQAINLAEQELNTGSYIEGKNVLELDELRNKINETYEKVETLNLDNLKKLDNDIKEYIKYRGWNGDDMLGKANVVHNAIVNKDPNAGGNTAFSQIKKEQEEREEINGTGGQHGLLGESTVSGDHSLDEILSKGKDFINNGNNQGNKIDANKLKIGSDTLYNILLTIGIILAVGVGMYLGVKFMLSSAEDKAKVKESLIPYIAGCVVIFGAFIIWKLAITLLGGIA